MISFPDFRSKGRSARSRDGSKKTRRVPLPVISAHDPLDTTPSLENHAGHRLPDRRPPPVRGREEVLHRQEGACSLGARVRENAIGETPCRVLLARDGKIPRPEPPRATPEELTDLPLLSASSRSTGYRRQARRARQGGLVPRLPRERGAYLDPTHPHHPRARSFAVRTNSKTPVEKSKTATSVGEKHDRRRNVRDVRRLPSTRF